MASGAEPKRDTQAGSQGVWRGGPRFAQIGPDLVIGTAHHRHRNGRGRLRNAAAYFSETLQATAHFQETLTEKAQTVERETTAYGLCNSCLAQDSSSN
eukprot:scaffold1740_cov254-Pinguiococcus_pyrenoidosus.AAC.17